MLCFVVLFSVFCFWFALHLLACCWFHLLNRKLRTKIFCIIKQRVYHDFPFRMAQRNFRIQLATNCCSRIWADFVRAWSGRRHRHTPISMSCTRIIQRVILFEQNLHLFCWQLDAQLRTRDSWRCETFVRTKQQNNLGIEWNYKQTAINPFRSNNGGSPVC